MTAWERDYKSIGEGHLKENLKRHLEQMIDPMT